MRRARVKSTRNRFPSSQRLDVDARGSSGAPACSSSAAGRDHRRRRFCFPRDVTHGCLVRRLASVAKGPRGGFDVGRADSVYLIGGPVYRDCSVDVRAVAVQPTPRLDYQPTSRLTGSASSGAPNGSYNRPIHCWRRPSLRHSRSGASSPPEREAGACGRSFDSGRRSRIKSSSCPPVRRRDDHRERRGHQRASSRM